MLHKNKSILYVDDTVEQRYAMRRILEGSGYTVLEAGSGAEAMRLLRADLCAIIMDVKLPDMSGYEVCRAIKATSAGAGIPVIQVSASFADPSMRVEALSGGADAYIAQPVHPQELLNLVRALVASHRSDRLLRFLASISLRISQSLDLKQTLRAICTATVPHFCDRCFVNLTEETDLSAEFSTPIAALQQLTTEITQSGKTKLAKLADPVCSVIAAPLETGSKRVGSILFLLAASERSYTGEDLPFAEDLATLVALAIQNAQLHTSQQEAQAALVRSEKLAAAGRMSAAIAHEINNPLEAVTNLIYLIEVSEDCSDTARKYAKEALSELSRLSHITRQTLGFYRELVGPQEFDLAESIEETLSLLNNRVAAKQIQVTKKYLPGLRLNAVKGEIRQVVSNLIVNALDAMEENGHLEVETSASADGARVVRISDTGKGIPPKLLGKIFEPFFTTKQGTGTGLGLWVSEEIVQKHGGRISARSETSGPQRGTTMEIVLSQNPFAA